MADLFENYFYENTPKEYRDYVARFDLTFLTPCSHQLKCKVSQFKGLITWAATRPIPTFYDAVSNSSHDENFKNNG